MRILVFGAGVLGSIFAARLYEAGQDVSLLARGERLAAIREHGVVIENVLTGRRTATPVPVVPELGPEDAYDLVLVIVRKEQVAAGLPTLAANRGTRSILFLHNNAAGPDAQIAALGRERVLLGFPIAGGTREGHLIRTYVSAGKYAPRVVMGELDGRTSPRLEQIAAALRGAGFAVRTSPNMDAWLKTHVALVSPVANAFYKDGGDNYRLARDPEGLRLMMQAVREGFAVLRALSIPITPPVNGVLARLPMALLLPLLRRTLNTQLAEIALAAHANAAPVEMAQLAAEFRALIRRAGIPTPAIDRLVTYGPAAATAD